MATTRAALRVLLAEALGGEFTARTTTGAGAVGGTTVVDAGLASKGDDYFNTWWVVLPLGPSGAGSYETRQVTGFASSTGTLTILAASAQVANGVPFELHLYNPVLLHLALNRSTDECYPHLYTPKRDESLVVDNILSNADFETFAAGAFTGWTAVGGPTVTAETSRKWHGAQAAKVVAAAGAAGQLTQTPVINIQKLTEQTASLLCRGYCTAASTARMRLDWDGATIESTAYHTGKDQWELLELTKSIPGTATQVKAILEVVANGTAFFDAASLCVSHIYKYTIPSAILRGPYILSIQRDLHHPDGPYDVLTDWHVEQDADGRHIVLNYAEKPHYRLRIEGIGKLSTMAADTGSTEVDAPHTRLFLQGAIIVLMQALLADPSVAMQGREAYLHAVAQAKEEFSRLVATPGQRHPRKAASMVPRWTEG